MTITDAILKMKRKFKMSGYNINNGNCDNFAYDVASILGEPKGLEVIEVDFDTSDLPEHFYIKFNGKYFDAECSNF